MDIPVSAPYLQEKSHRAGAKGCLSMPRRPCTMCRPNTGHSEGKGDMVTMGIVYGLACATAQSTSYIFSRRFVLAHSGGPMRLFAISHVIMGIISAGALLLLWPAPRNRG